MHFTCNYCDTTSFNIYHWNKHKNSIKHKVNIIGEIRCKTCDKGFDCKSRYTKHLHNVHNRQKDTEDPELERILNLQMIDSFPVVPKRINISNIPEYIEMKLIEDKNPYQFITDLLVSLENYNEIKLFFNKLRNDRHKYKITKAIYDFNHYLNNLQLLEYNTFQCISINELINKISDMKIDYGHILSNAFVK